MFDYLSQSINIKKNQQRYRQRQCITNQFDNIIVVDGITYKNFSSNDYLGLVADKSLHLAFTQATETYGVSAASSSLVTGYHDAHYALEQTIAQWLNKERVLLFSSGFAANCGFLSAVDRKDNHFILDKLSHASLIDGASQGRSQFSRFKHNDIAHLQHRLSNSNSRYKTIVAESIYSMDGDIAPVASIQSICQQSNALLYIDDAHGIGVLGESGAGISAQTNNGTVIMATFGKAIGTGGACIACNEVMADYLVNECRHYIYSTAISPAMAFATKTSIELIQQQQWRRDKLTDLVALFKRSLLQEITITSSESSIIGVIVGSEAAALKMSELLKQRKFWVTAIRPPTVPNGQSRLRVTINSAHNRNDIIGLAKNINEVYLQCQIA